MGAWLARLRLAAATWSTPLRVTFGVVAAVGTNFAFERAIYWGDKASWVGDVEITVGVLAFLTAGTVLRRSSGRTLLLVALAVSVFAIVAVVRYGPLLLLTLPATVLWPVAASFIDVEERDRRPYWKRRPARIG